MQYIQEPSFDTIPLDDPIPAGWEEWHQSVVVPVMFGTQFIEVVPSGLRLEGEKLIHKIGTDYIQFR